MAKKTGKDKSPRIVNRRARHDYHIMETLEVGLALLGSEVKSVRDGQVSLAEGYARIEPADMQLYLYEVDIARYVHSGPDGHETKRRRKLLAHSRQIKQLLALTTDKGTTLIPLTMYFVRGRVKLELAVARGKRSYDKRDTMKQRESDREIRKAMTRKRI